MQLVPIIYGFCIKLSSHIYNVTIYSLFKPFQEWREYFFYLMLPNLVPFMV